MRAGVFHGPGDIRVEDVDDPVIKEPTDAIVRVVRSSVCGSDLWSYRDLSPAEAGGRVGHEVTGIIEAVGDDVAKVKVGDLVVVAFSWSCGECEFCLNGLQTSCPKGAFPGGLERDGGQGERLLVEHIDGSSWVVPADTPESRYDAVHLLSDVLLTGYHAAKMAGVGAPGLDGSPITTAVVIGDGAVGLSGVLSAKLLGATTIVAVGHHADRLEIAAQLGATHTTDLRDRELVKHVRNLTDGGAPAVLECVGITSSLKTAASVARPGGTVGAVGVPHTESLPIGRLFGSNIALRFGVAPVRAYMDEVGPRVASGEIDPSAIASHRFSLDELPGAYAAMDQREAIKSILLPA